MRHGLQWVFEQMHVSGHPCRHQACCELHKKHCMPNCCRVSNIQLHISLAASLPCLSISPMFELAALPLFLGCKPTMLTQTARSPCSRATDL